MPFFRVRNLGLLIIAIFFASGNLLADGDPTKGEEVFKLQCSACHNYMEGAKPDIYGVVLPLYGIFGEKAAQTTGFFYSKSMRTSGLTWTEENLDKYLKDPKGFMPGVRMEYPGLKDPQQRKDIIAYFGGAASQQNTAVEPASSATKEQSTDPLKAAMGGEPFGHGVQEIADGVYVFRWWVYRNIFIITDEGVIVTDPMNPKAAKLLKAEIQKITNKPIKYVVYSHNHHDHISGGNIFDDDGVKFVGHHNLKKELEDHPSPIIPVPDITFNETYTVQLGKRKLELKYLGPNHGDSLVVMRLPKENIVFVVDIVTPRRVAFRTMPDFWPDEWIRSLRELEKMNAKTVVSGHGSHLQPATDSPSVITEQREYLEDLMAEVKAAMDAGTRNPDVLRKTIKLPKYENWQFYDEWLPMNIERIWAYYHMGW